MTAFQKTKANRSEAYLAWVRRQPSVESGSYGCVAHHIVGHGRCGTVKSDDFLALPLTDSEHKRLHDHGWREWEDRNGSQLEHAARMLVKAISEGVLELNERAAREVFE